MDSIGKAPTFNDSLEIYIRDLEKMFKKAMEIRERERRELRTVPYTSIETILEKIVYEICAIRAEGKFTIDMFQWLFAAFKVFDDEECVRAAFLRMFTSRICCFHYKMIDNEKKEKDFGQERFEKDYEDFLDKLTGDERDLHEFKIDLIRLHFRFTFNGCVKSFIE